MTAFSTTSGGRPSMPRERNICCHTSQSASLRPQRWHGLSRRRAGRSTVLSQRTSSACGHHLRREQLKMTSSSFAVCLSRPGRAWPSKTLVPSKV
ncbi:hypothetical protein PO909_029718 [Leuciscus waleckii]